MTKNKPNFLGIGMQRSGTSWIYTMLACHPDIWLPPLKEMHFFDVRDPDLKADSRRYNLHLGSRLKQKMAFFRNFQNRPELYKNSPVETLKWDLEYFTGSPSLEWYQSLFSDTYTKGRICGEITPLYCNVNQDSIKAMLSLNPEMKFIMMIRHPIQRAWSAMILYHHNIKKQSFDTVTTDQMLAWLERERAQITSDVLGILRKWTQSIPKKQLLIRPFEAIKSNPEILIDDLYTFLGVDNTFRPPENLYLKKINTKTKTHYTMPPEIAEEFEKRFTPMIETLKRDFPEISSEWK